MKTHETAALQARIPDDVIALLESFLAHLDRALPGHIEGLYLVGSLALGDYQPGRSDIDFVAVSASSLEPERLNRLDQIHGAVRAGHPRPHLDGIYITWEYLRQNSATLDHIAFSHEGRFRRAGAFEANPAVWLTLRHHAIGLRGPARPEVCHDPAGLDRWTRENLNTYWRGLAEQVRSAQDAGRMLPDQAIAWCVPGILRLR